MNEQQQLFERYGLEVETVGDLLEGREAAPEVRAPFVVPVLDGYPVEWPGDGIFFDFDEETYHAVPALSNGGIKTLASSPLLYWAKCRWMNPDYEEQEEKEHFDIGKGYHARILEGREAFQQRFVIGLDKADYPNALVTTDDIKAAFPEGVKAKGKNKREMFEHLKTLDGTVELWEDIKAAFDAENEGKTFMSPKTLRQLEIGARMIENDEELSGLFKGGHPEVSLFWTCPRTGIRKKARVDYLKIKMMVDLKTFANSKEQRPENAIRFEIANRRYAIQPSHYFEGAAEVRKLVRANGASAIHGTEEQAAWALKWASHVEPDEWAWVFIQKGIAPIARGLFYPRAGTTKMLCDDICSVMSKRFREFANHHGVEPWIDSVPIYDLADEDLPAYASEI